MSRKILIIDDSPTLRRLLGYFLVKKGYIVYEAHNGRVGLDRIAKETFDLIVLDMVMPVMNGAQVLEKLREFNDFKIPIVVLSAAKEENSKAICISLGASDYITKPFKPHEFAARIENRFPVQSRAIAPCTK